MAAYQSRGTVFACFASDAGSNVLRVATPVMDLLAKYVPDYTVE